MSEAMQAFVVHEAVAAASWTVRAGIRTAGEVAADQYEEWLRRDGAAKA